MTLLELTSLIGRLVQVESTANVWVTAEVSDFSVRGGHCYMELVEKSADGSATLARSRAVIWANNFRSLSYEFLTATGQSLGPGMKVMVRVIVSHHPVYGLSLVINGINPEFTVGDMVRRRREMINRLTEEGIIDMNRTLEWSEPANRIAVISSPGAAGYGDFVHQLFNNGRRLRFNVRLFDAIMQGQRSARSIVEALDRIAAEIERWDCVVIIRGGGASDDLSCFDDYVLAENIAQFPIPVVIGIGHERDVTLLDYVANMRVKTPTAAAEWLIAQVSGSLDRLIGIGDDIARCATDMISGYHDFVERSATMLPILSQRVVERRKSMLDSCVQSFKTLVPKHLAMESARLDTMRQLIDTLSPEATLRRGYTITLGDDGRAVVSAASASSNRILTTVFADGKIVSKL